MAWRTNQELVSRIIDIEEDDLLDGAIDTANQLVTDACAASGYSDAKLELIERWLAAHFYDINRPRTSLEAISGGTQEQYERVTTDLFLNNTKFGQQAIMLDTAGNLAALCNKAKKGVAGPSETKWLGSVLE